MSTKLIAVAVALLAGGAVVFALTVPKSAGTDGSGGTEEIAALKKQVSELQKEVSTLRDAMGASVATAAPSAARELAPAKPAAAAGGSASAPTVSGVDRDAIFALIKEERDLREQERAEKARTQAREATTRRVKALAERLGFDASTTNALVKVYLDSMNREDDVRKAYPLAEIDDANMEKRRLELDAIGKDRDSAVAGLVPADKKDEWNRRARFMSRGGDIAEMGQAWSNGDFGAMGAMFRGPGGGGGGTGPGGPVGGNGQGGNGPRRNRGGQDGGNGGAQAPPVQPPGGGGQ